MLFTKGIIALLVLLTVSANAAERDPHCGRWISRRREPIAPESLVRLSPRSLEALWELIDALENMDWNLDEAAGYVEMDRIQFGEELRKALSGHDGRICVAWPPGSANLKEVAYINFKRLNNQQLELVIRLYRTNPDLGIYEKFLRRMEKELAEREPEGDFQRLRDSAEDWEDDWD